MLSYLSIIAFLLPLSGAAQASAGIASQVIGKAEACPAFGCVSVTYNGDDLRAHIGAGMAFGGGISVSGSQTSCQPHDEGFVNGPFGGVSWNRRGPLGPWHGPNVGIGPSWPKVGFGILHWFN